MPEEDVKIDVTDEAIDKFLADEEATKVANAAVEAEKAKAAEDPEVDLKDLGKMKLSEIKKGFLLHKDYTQKTQALAKDKETVEAQKAALDDMTKYDTFLTAHPKAAAKIKAIIDKVNIGGMDLEDAGEEIDAVINNEQNKNQSDPEVSKLRNDIGSLKIDLAMKDLRTWVKETYPSFTYEDKDIIDHAVKIGIANVDGIKAAWKDLYFDKVEELGKNKLIEKLKKNNGLKVDDKVTVGNKGKEEVITVKDFDDAGKQALNMIDE